MRRTNILKNQFGMSLIEVMIVMTIMSLIGLGTATLMKNMFSIQRRGTLKAIAKELKNNLEVVIRNDTAWAVAVNNNASLGCLRDTPVPAGGCAHTPYNNNPSAPNAPMAQNPTVYNIDATIFYDASSATEGFDADSGASCSTFDGGGGTGDDDCPFRYTVNIYTECPGAASPCLKPQVTIVGILLFNPADPSDPRNKLNTMDYTITFKRGERSRYEPFEIQYSPAGNTGGGDCPAAVNNAGVRPLNNAAEYDVGGNVQGINAAAGQFTLGPGTYECKLTAQCYEAIDGCVVEIVDLTNGGTVVSGGAFCGYNSSCYATGTGQIQLTANATFALRHTCGSDGSEPDSAHDYAEGYEMGIPALNSTGGYGGGAGGNVYTSISCVRSS